MMRFGAKRLFCVLMMAGLGLQLPALSAEPPCVRRQANRLAN